MPDYRILITGSRDWSDYAKLSYELGLAVGAARSIADVVIVHGQCPSGADALAAGLCRQYRYRQEPHPADWAAHGKAAGFRRNAEMVSLGADVCLCFVMPCTDPKCRRPGPHGSHGASHCAQLAEANGIEVRRFTP